MINAKIKKLPEYKTWFCMKSRCLDPDSTDYEDYGGRGITIYSLWINSFEEFYKYMGSKPGKQYSIDRINVNGNYEPGNVRWATPKQQADNKRCNINITYNGKTQNISNWAKEIGVKRLTLRNRLEKWGWSIEKALTKPTFKGNKINFNGKEMTLLEWSEELNIPYSALYQRLKIYNYSIKEAFTISTRDQYVFNNKSQSLMNWSKELEIPYHTLHSRLHRDKWSIKKAFTTPVRGRTAKQGV